MWHAMGLKGGRSVLTGSDACVSFSDDDFLSENGVLRDEMAHEFAVDFVLLS